MKNHNFTGNRYQVAEILQISDDKYDIFVCNLLNTLKGGY